MTMWVVYDVLKHRCRSLNWSPEQARRFGRIDTFKRIAEMPSSMAEQIIEDIKLISKDAFFEGIARYEQSRLQTPLGQPQIGYQAPGR